MNFLERVEFATFQKFELIFEQEESEQFFIRYSSKDDVSLFLTKSFNLRKHSFAGK